MPAKTKVAFLKDSGGAVSTSIARQQWLEKGCAALRARFSKCKYDVPKNVRVSIGWPRGSHGKGRAIGQCWSTEASVDKWHEIFVSPELGAARKGKAYRAMVESIRILGVLAHELAHACVGVEAGHKAPFKRCATAVGLEGKMTATTEGAAFIEWAKAYITKAGTYPAGALNVSFRKKQSTRLIKCQCDDCDYVARVTRKWIDSAGAPICPTDEIAMRCEEV